MEKEASIGMLVAGRLGVPDLVRPVAIIHRGQKPLTPTPRRFIDLLREAAAKLGEVDRTTPMRRTSRRVPARALRG